MSNKKFYLSELHARSIIAAIDIIHKDKAIDNDGKEIDSPAWMTFDNKMCLDDLLEAKNKIKKGLKQNG